MQMAACNASGMANVTDDLPGLHLLTGGDADGRTVGVQRFQPAAVVDLNVVAVTASPTIKAIGNSDHAICGGEDWRALGAGNVGAGVGTDLTGDGVYAVAKLRGNCTRNRQRPLQWPVGARVPSGDMTSPPPCSKPPSNSAHSSSYCGSCKSCR